MADGLVPALVKFGETLSDKSVGTSKKLRVLNTLNDVKLTLTELSESGLGRTVSRLKSEPGELGQTARTLIAKWKQLLQTYLNRESSDVSTDNQSSVGASKENQEGRMLEQKKTTTKLRKVTPTRSDSTPDNGDESPENNGVLQTIPQSEFTPNHHNCTQDKTSHVKSPNKSQSSIKATHLVETKKQPIPTTSSSTSYINSPNETGSLTPDDHLPSTTPRTSKPAGKRKSTETSDCIDASSGLSFMESLCVGSTAPVRKKRPKTNKKGPIASIKESPLPRIPPQTVLRPSAEFTAEVLSSLNEDVDRPDIISRSRTGSCPALKQMDDMDDGNLKFKSKKILWVPKASRAVKSMNDNAGQDTDFDPPSLIDLCLNVVERNLSRVDHVGQVPYELLGRALRHASPAELSHIEEYNPQFVGCSDDLWQRHVQREFQHSKEQTPRDGETWCEFYNRLANDESKRLDRIIHRSARKIKEEMEARRTTRTTEAIAPREFQKRARQSGLATFQASSSSKTNSMRPFGQPTNVSRSNASSASSVHGSATAISSSGATNTPGQKPNAGGGLLSKLRKQFHSGRLR